MITSPLAQPGQVQPRRYLGSSRVCQDVPLQRAEMASQPDYGKLTSASAPACSRAGSVLAWRPRARLPGARAEAQACLAGLVTGTRTLSGAGRGRSVRVVRILACNYSIYGN
jgi:hypothetical protein